MCVQFTFRIDEARFGCRNASACMNDLRLAAQLAAALMHGAHEAHRQIDRGEALACLQRRVHRAAQGRVEQRRHPSAVDRAEWIAETIRRQPLECGAAGRGFDEQEVQDFTDRGAGNFPLIIACRNSRPDIDVAVLKSVTPNATGRPASLSTALLLMIVVPFAAYADTGSCFEFYSVMRSRK